MNKVTVIGGIMTAAVTVSVGTYLTWGNLPDQGALEDSLLQDYKELLEEMKDSKTKSLLAGSCDNPQSFADRIQALETKFDHLKKRKNDALNEKVYVPPLPEFTGDEVRTPPVPELTGDDFVPPLPEFTGEQDDGASDLPPLPEEKEWIPDLPPLPDEEEWIPDLPPLPNEEGYIPPLPEMDGNDMRLPTVLDAINALEAEITLELNALKSMCDEKENTEVISTSCVDACKKYSDCAGYTEGATKEDQQDAYDSCMEECAKWSDKTTICINKKPIRTITDCTHLSICALAEYSNVLGR